MIRTTFLLLLLQLILGSICTHAQVYQTLEIDGFNHDVIAEARPASTYTTAAVDATSSGANNAFMSINYQNATVGLPANGLITSIATATPGLTFQLAPYDQNNSLKINANNETGTLTVQTTDKFSKLYLLATSGSSASTFTGTITFTDATTQTFASQSVPDWYDQGTPAIAIRGIGRVPRTGTEEPDNNTTNPKLFQVAIDINSDNQNKIIQQVAITKTSSTSGFLNIFALSGEITPTCIKPDALGIQNLTATSVDLTWTSPGTTFDIKWGERNFNVTTAGTLVTGFAHGGTLAGLTADTNYDYYVRRDCGAVDGVSAWAGPFQFRTGYCIPTGATNNSDEIRNFKLSNLNNNSTASEGTAGYKDYSGTVEPAILEIGEAYVASLASGTGTGTHGAAIWIDYNNDLVFEDNERVSVIGNTITPDTTANFPSFTVPATVDPGIYRLRVQYQHNKSGADLDPCTITSIYAETEDYAVQIIPTCVTPTGLTVSAVGLDKATLTWQATSSTNTNGYTYEVRTSGEPGGGTDGLAFTGTTDAATTSVDLSDLTTGTLYWVYVMANCGAEDNSYWTDGVPFTPDWCQPTYSTGSSNHRINIVRIDEINFTDEIPSYTSRDRTGITVPDLTAGDTYTFNVTTTGYTGMGVAIDFNNDGNFDEVDEVLALPEYSGNGTHMYTASVTIPMGVYSGTYRMRIWNRGGNAGGGEGSGPCGSYDYGTWADYTVNLTGGRTPCIIPDLISTTPDAICGPGQAELEATYTAGTVKWYAAATGGSALATGNTFITPEISQTTSYWVSAHVDRDVHTVGRTASDTASTYMDEGSGLIFDALESVELQSVSVYAVTAGTINIQIVNSAGTEIYSTGNVDVIAGGSTTPNIIPLDFTVPTGTGYKILIKSYSGANLIRESNIGGFPYTDENLVITNGYFLGISASYYYYFYDIKYAAVCATPRTEVVATVTTPPVLTLSETEIAICPGSSSDAVTVTAGASDYDIYTWSPAIGVSGDAQDGWVFNPTISTTYTLTATQAEGEQCWAEFELQVDVHRLEVSGSQVDVTCYGGEDGSAAVTISEGQAPYSYVWTHDADLDGGQAIGLSVGAYIVTVTDANGCTATVDFDITEPVAVSSPEVESTVAYVYGDPTVPLTATAALDHTLRWYTVASGGTGSLTAPIPTSSEVGVQRFWVSQITAEGCESERAMIEVSVAAATLTIVADAKTKVYGEVDPLWTYTVSGLQYDDEAVYVLTGSLARDAGESVDDYAITQGTLAALANYTLDYVSADLTITPAVLTVTADAQTKGYGEADPLWTYTVSGLRYNDEEDDVLTGSLARDAGEAVGDYAITKGTLAASANYTLHYVSADLTITPAVLTVTADAGQSKEYGDADPVLRYQVSGWKRTDGADLLRGALARAAGEEVGAYTITQGTLDAGANYTITYICAEFVIQEAELRWLILPDTQYVFDGSPHVLRIVGSVPLGVTVSYTNDVRTDAGKQTVYAAVSGPGYRTLELEGILEVLPRPLTVRADPLTKLLGASDPHLSYAVDGLLEGVAPMDVLSGTLRRVVGERPGSYLIGQGSLRATSDYTIDQYVPALLTIDLGLQLVSLDAQPLHMSEREVREVRFDLTNIGMDDYTAGAVIDWDMEVGPGAEITQIAVEGMEVVELGGAWRLHVLDPWPSGQARTVVLTLKGADRYVGRSTLDVRAWNPYNRGGMADAVQSMDLLIEQGEYYINIPNVFTPNGDGLNDFFRIDGLNSFDRVELFVYNSQGVEVYRHENYRNTWDAHGLGDGTYLYIVRTYRGRSGQDHRGYVLVKRR